MTPDKNLEQTIEQRVKFLVECAKKGDATQPVVNQIMKEVQSYGRAENIQGHFDGLANAYGLAVVCADVKALREMMNAEMEKLAKQLRTK